MSPANDERRTSRRLFLGGVAGVALGSTSAGCLETSLSLEDSEVDDSPLFESISLMESWTVNYASAKISLTNRASREENARELSVVDSKGSTVWTGTISAGQTSISSVLLPVGSATTIALANGSKEYIGEVRVRVTGSSIP